MKKNNILAYTDGSAKSNKPRDIAGFAFVIVHQKRIIHTYSEFVKKASNDQVELLAIINAIEWFIDNYKTNNLIVFSDCKFCVNGFNSWMHSWRQNDWRTTKGEVKNLEMWLKLYELHSILGNRIRLNWIKSHNGDIYNNMADKLCREIWKNK